MRAAVVAVAVLALAPAAWAQGGRVQVRDAWIRLPPNGSTTAAAYVDVLNAGREHEQLIGASCRCAAKVELHEMSTSGGMMRMAPIKGGLPIPPAGELRLQPGGDHFMLLGLKAPLHAGERVPLTLEFSRAGRMTVEAVVGSAPPAPANGGPAPTGE